MGSRTPFATLPTGVVDYTLTQSFHEGPAPGNPSRHRALDMVGRDGQVAMAINAGRVWHAGWESDGWVLGGGYSAIIFHGPASRPTMRTAYCHGKAVFVIDNQLVLPGQNVIVCDSMGYVTGSHLHHDVQLWDGAKWVPVDPYRVYPAHKSRGRTHSQGDLFNDPRANTAVVVTGSVVNLRTAATTKSATKGALWRGAVMVYDGAVNGERPPSAGATGSTVWFRVWWKGPSGWLFGYVWSGLVKLT